MSIEATIADLRQQAREAAADPPGMFEFATAVTQAYSDAMNARTPPAVMIGILLAAASQTVMDMPGDQRQAGAAGAMLALMRTLTDQGLRP